MSARPQDRATAKVLAARREQLAVQMVLAGATYQAIADTLMPCPRHQVEDQRALPGCPDCRPMYASRASAYKAVRRALQRDYATTTAERDELRQLQLAQIATALRAVWPRVLTAGKGQDRAILSAVRLLDRQSRLMGLDAPTRIELTTELDAEIERLVEQLAGIDAGDPQGVTRTADAPLQ